MLRRSILARLPAAYTLLHGARFCGGALWHFFLAMAVCGAFACLLTLFQ